MFEALCYKSSFISFFRETRDGCDPCPGPFGGPRNRTVEASSGTAPARKPAAPKPAPQQAAAPAQGNFDKAHG